MHLEALGRKSRSGEREPDQDRTCCAFWNERVFISGLYSGLRSEALAAQTRGNFWVGEPLRHPLKGPCKDDKRGAGSSLSHLFLHPPHLTRGSQAQGQCDFSKATQHVRGATGPDLQLCSASWPALLCAWRALRKTGVPLHPHLFLLGPSPCIQKRLTGQRVVCTEERRRLAGDGDLKLCSWDRAGRIIIHPSGCGGQLPETHLFLGSCLSFLHSLELHVTPPCTSCSLRTRGPHSCSLRTTERAV